MEIARLTNVPIRDVWPHEATSFTPWLADNLGQIGEVVGLDLELVGIEMPVGPFRVDVVARVVGTEDIVVIENQYGATDHDHLGKLLTYAAGQDAAYLIWIAESIRPEHRSALEWANRNSIEGVGYHALRVEALRIGDSAVAPRLVPVVTPDGWAKQAVDRTAGSLSPKAVAYREFWGEFLEQIKAAHPGWTNASKAPAQNWINLPARKNAVVYGVVFAGNSRLRVELYVDGPDAETQSETWSHFTALRPQIEAELGPLVWEELPNSRASRIALYTDTDVDPQDDDGRPALLQWALRELGEFRRVLQPIIDRI